VKQTRIEPRALDTQDVHIHVPAGAIPKDGPSAGIAMATALVSILSGHPVRNDVAMTGEVTLRGRVLPIGGLKEKALGAVRAGINAVIIPRKNVKDLTEIPPNLKRRLKFIPVQTMEEVLANALEPAKPVNQRARRKSASPRTARKPQR
jgi:ATP-dependent Lon protease